MDKALSKQELTPAGVSVRNGPVIMDKMDVDEPATNGKRKSRGSAVHMKSYKDNDTDDDDNDDGVKPVRLFGWTRIPLLPIYI